MQDADHGTSSEAEEDIKTSSVTIHVLNTDVLVQIMEYCPGQVWLVRARLVEEACAHVKATIVSTACARLNCAFHSAASVRLQRENNMTLTGGPVIAPRIRLTRPTHALQLQILHIDNGRYNEHGLENEHCLVTSESALEIAEYVKDMPVLLTAKLDFSTASSFYSDLGLALLYKHVRHVDIKIDPTLCVILDGWQRVIYGTAQSLEFLGIYVMEATQTPENVEEIVAQTTKLRLSVSKRTQKRKTRSCPATCSV